MSASHVWVRARYGTQRRELLAAGPAMPVLAALDAHRRLRGPYTAIGALLREIVPQALRHCPDIVTRHEIEILSLAPELRDTVPSTRETLTSLAVPEERTRFYSRLRTLRHAHGITEFVNEYLRHLDGPTCCLRVDNLDHADPTDREVFAVMLRRADTARLRLRLATTDVPAEEPPGPVGAPLVSALRRYAQVVTTGTAQPTPPTPDMSTMDAARAYVWGDCVDDAPAYLEAYAALDPDARAALHDERAQELADGDWSWRLGAIAWHHEHGSQPERRGAQALREALEYCVNMGFYHATIDYGERGRALVDWTAELEHWWAFTTKMTTSLLALGRPLEALAFYDEARAHTDSSMVHMQAAYATSMIYTRHLDTDERDHRRARAWSNAAIAYARLVPDPRDRAAHLVFNRNGLALVAMHEGKLTEALRLVSDGMAELDAALGAEEHQLHRSVLRHNRSQLLSALGRPDEALAELDAVIAADPNYAEYHLDRGSLLRKLGRDAEALAEYDRALTLSPPFPEVYYNRADTLAELGDVDGALAGFDYVLELDPEHLDALVNRAGLRYALDDVDGAWADVRAGLALAADNPHLLCVRGQLELAIDAAVARATLTEAVTADPALAGAWAARATAAHLLGDLPAALHDLDRALEIQQEPAMRFNRALILLDLGRFDEADQDFEACLKADPDLAEDVRQQRERLSTVG